jgi:hypothetical protein
MTPISNQPSRETEPIQCRETEPIQWCRTRLLMTLFVMCILLMGNGARAECSAHDVLQRHLSRAGHVATAPVLRVPQQQKDNTNSGSLEIESWVCDSDLTVLLVHSWYSEDCCHDRDCHPVPCSEISRDSNGDFIWKPETRFAGPSEQRLPTEVLFPKKRLKVSQDEACHVCISPNTTPAGICIYLPYKA